MTKSLRWIVISVLALAGVAGLVFLAGRLRRASPGAQYDAYEKLSAASLTPLELSLQDGFPRGVVGRIPVPGAGPVERAQAFLDQYRDFYLQSDPRLELHFRRLAGPDLEDVLFYQTYSGLPVYGGEILVTLKGGEVFGTAGGLLPAGIDLETVPNLAAEDAESIARSALDQPDDAPIFGVSQLVVYDPSLSSEAPREPHLAWRVTIGDRDPRIALVDAHDGSLLLQFSLYDTDTDGYDLDLEHANGENGSDTSCYWDTIEDDQVADEDGLYEEADFTASNLYNFSWQAYLFYHDTFGRHSYDNDDGQLEIYEHASVDNASWLGASVDCDLIEFSDGWVEYDVFVHELTHGVVDFTSDFSGAGQPGSLNESYADIMASLADGTWTMGEGLAGGPIRSLSNPPDYVQAGFNQPDHMNEFVYTSVDDFGEHVNTGILSFAHYLIAVGGAHPDTGVEVSGLGNGAMGYLAYYTMTSLGSGAKFIDARNRTVSLADAAYEPLASCQVRNAFYAVGLGKPDIDCDGTENDPDPDGDGLPFGRDNCPFLANPDQVDSDQDGLGSGCDFDDNANGVPDYYETQLANPYNLCPTPGTPCDLGNYDGDNFVNDEDNCPWDVNNGQEDEDGDGEGDACDPDEDSDGWSNNDDNCPFTANSDQMDSDGDGAGDACDPTPDCADVNAWSAGVKNPTGDGYLVEPHPIADPLACPGRYQVAGSGGSLKDLLAPGGGGRMVDVSGEGERYVKLPLPACPPDDDALAPDYRGQLMLDGLAPDIRAWVARTDGMAASNDRDIGGARILRFQPQGGYDYHLVLALFGAAEEDPTSFEITLDCGLDLLPAGTPEPSATPTLEATPTETPTLTPTPTPEPLAFGDPKPSSATFFYGRDTCGPMQVTMDVTLMGGDPAAGPYDVLMLFRLAEVDGPGRTAWSALAMNPGGEGAFSRTIDSESDIPGFNTYILAWLQLQFIASDPQGAEAARSMVFPMLVQLSRCPR